MMILEKPIYVQPRATIITQKFSHILPFVWKIIPRKCELGPEYLEFERKGDIEVKIKVQTQKPSASCPRRKTGVLGRKATS
jgi:hypothetical protein